MMARPSPPRPAGRPVVAGLHIANDGPRVTFEHAVAQRVARLHLHEIAVFQVMPQHRDNRRAFLLYEHAAPGHGRQKPIRIGCIRRVRVEDMLRDGQSEGKARPSPFAAFDPDATPCASTNRLLIARPRPAPP